MAIATDKELIRRMFTRLPVSERFDILQDLIQILSPIQGDQSNLEGTFYKALGLLEADSPPPTDQQVEKMLREHRLEKYG